MREHLKKYLDRGEAANLRGLRMLLEYFYATEKFAPIKKAHIPIVSVFGSARARGGSTDYQTAYQLGKKLYQSGFAVVTGASRGIMQAANQGVADAIAEELVRKRSAQSKEAARNTKAYDRRLKKYSLGLRISLPFEEEANPYIGSGAEFHYFMIRKFFFANLSSAFVACEGGWGTRDELFEMMTLVQTGKSPLMPIIYLSTNPEHLARDLRYAVAKQYTSQKDLRIIDLVRTPDAAVKIIGRFYRHIRRISVKKTDVFIALRNHPTTEFRHRIEQGLKKIGSPIKSYRWHKKDFHIIDFDQESYGYLRDIVDLINEQ